MKDDNDPKTRPKDPVPPETDADNDDEDEKPVDPSKHIDPETLADILESAEKVNRARRSGVPLSPEDHFVRGLSLFYKGRFEQALRALNQATKANPRYSAAWGMKAFVLGPLKRYKEGLRAVEKALQIGPPDPILWSVKGTFLRDLKRYEEALAAFDRAIELKPDNPTAWADKGRTLDSLGRTEEALKASQRAVALKPNDPEAWINKGVLLSALKRQDHAIECFRRALDIDPDSNLAWYDVACASARKGDKATSLAALSKAIELAEKWRKRARTDEDFDAFRNDDEFKKIVGEPGE